MPTDPSLPTAETTTANGIDLLTRTVGSGTEVILLHGGPSAGHVSLLPAMDALADGRQLRYYDQRGCGGSPVTPDVPLGWQFHVDDLRVLIDSWQIEKATIVGHSWGALLSLLYAIQHPDRVKCLLLVAPASITARGRREYLERLGRRLSERAIVRQQRDLIRSGLRQRDPVQFRRSAFALTLAPYLKNPKCVPDVEPFRISHRVREAVWRSLGDYDLRDELSAISLRALVIHGVHDPIPLSSAEEIATVLEAGLEVFEDSGHMPFFEETERFMAVAGDFLPKD